MPLATKDWERVLEKAEKRSDLEVTHTAAKTFHGFPVLPLELREKILEDALPGPQVVEILYCGATQLWFVPSESYTPHDFLFVSTETRRIYKKNYKSLPSGRVASLRRSKPCICNYRHAKTANPDCHGHQVAYIRTKIDTLFIGGAPGRPCSYPEHLLQLLTWQSFSDLKKLAVFWIDFERHVVPKLRREHLEFKVLEHFPNLTSISLAYDRNQFDYRGVALRCSGVAEGWLRDGKNRAAQGPIELVDMPTDEESFQLGETSTQSSTNRYISDTNMIDWLRDFHWKDRGLDLELKVVVRGGLRMLQYDSLPPPGFKRLEEGGLAKIDNKASTARNNPMSEHVGGSLREAVEPSEDNGQVQKKPIYSISFDPLVRSLMERMR